MKNTSIIEVTTSDLSKLQAIGRTTFLESFGKQNTEADMEQYLRETFSEAVLRRELENPHSLFYFALVDKQVIGYLKLNFGSSQTELRDPNAAEIERIYVLQAYQGKNVGRLLYEKALERSMEQGVHYLWLGVWEKNPRAIRFYEKCGFVPFDTHIFKLGNDRQTDILMKKEISTRMKSVDELFQ